MNIIVQWTDDYGEKQMGRMFAILPRDETSECSVPDRAVVVCNQTMRIGTVPLGLLTVIGSVDR